MRFARAARATGREDGSRAGAAAVGAGVAEAAASAGAAAASTAAAPRETGEMSFARFWRHVSMTPWKARGAFPDAVLDAIQHEVAEQEKGHRGEVRFVVERELTTAQLWAGTTSRQRAI